MPKMIAKSVFEYAGRRLQKREAFEAKPRDARVLAIVGRAQYAEATDDAPAPVDAAVAAGPKSRRAYRRRDLQAEG